MPAGSSTPQVAVAVAATERPVRLRWLLNALEAQTLDRGRFEVVVGHGPGRGDVEGLLSEYPLAARAASAEGSGRAALHDAAWRAGESPLVAFTTDACRPAPDWLERMLEAAERHPRAVIQGRTQPDPTERWLMLAPRHRTAYVDPPDRRAEALNVVYTRELLERLDGFDEGLGQGAAADLMLRAEKAGAQVEGEPAALAWHGVLSVGLPAALADAVGRRDLIAVLQRHPELRASFPGFPFVSRRHALLAPALAVALLTRRATLAVAAAVPYGADVARWDPALPSPLAERLLRIPGRALEDAVGIAALGWASLLRRTLLL